MLRLLTALLTLLALPAAAEPLSIVAAENFYGGIAQQIAGPGWTVTSILSNPDQDPHLFEASPAVARAVSAASIVVENGVGYDPWMDKLLSASPRSGRATIVAGDLLGRKPGDNPHIWYDPACMPAFARALTLRLDARDPAHRAEYDARLAAFLKTLTALTAKVAALAAQFKDVPVTATEPVFGWMAQAIGLDMHDPGFQLSVMNDTEPSASDVAAMETDLRQHRVRVLFYNSQASDTAATRVVNIAKAAHIPVVGVTETEPSGRSYVAWMVAQLDATEKALAAKP